MHLTGHLLLALLLMGPGDWSEQTQLPATGKATYYAQGLMERVWVYRTRAGDVKPCPECVGAVAMVRKGDLGRKVWLRYNGQTFGPFLVVDCANPRHVANLLSRGSVVEVPYWVAQAWRMYGPIQVTVLAEPGGEVAKISPP